MGEHIVIDGHLVEAAKADMFFNMSDGSRVTDEQWDESRARMAAMEALGDDYVSWIPIADFNGKGDDSDGNA